MRPTPDIERALETHGDTVWRVCVLYFGQKTDAHDAFQDTWLKYSLCETAFVEEEHRKAWLIRVAINKCKDMLKAAYRKTVSLDDAVLSGIADAASLENTDNQASIVAAEVVEAMRSLGDPPRTSLYLALYEGYTAPEISKMLDVPVNTVYSWIARGKKQLKEVLR